MRWEKCSSGIDGIFARCSSAKSPRDVSKGKPGVEAYTIWRGLLRCNVPHAWVSRRKRVTKDSDTGETPVDLSLGFLVSPRISTD
jgi:hypothetical protein